MSMALHLPRSPCCAAATASASALAGCAVNQPAPPALDLPPPAASAADNALLERWWTLFDDPALTALIDAFRAVMLDGASMAGIGGEAGILAGWSVVCFGIALRVFRWK